MPGSIAALPTTEYQQPLPDPLPKNLPSHPPDSRFPHPRVRCPPHLLVLELGLAVRLLALDEDAVLEAFRRWLLILRCPLCQQLVSKRVEHVIGHFLLLLQRAVVLERQDEGVRRLLWD